LVVYSIKSARIMQFKAELAGVKSTKIDAFPPKPPKTDEKLTKAVKNYVMKNYQIFVSFAF